MQTIPYVGLIVDFYPLPSERRAAIITNVYFDGDATKRPKVDLEIFGEHKTTQKFQFEVPPVEEITTELELKGCWAFAHEFAILQDAEHNPETEEGIHSNAMVGQLQAQY